MHRLPEVCIRHPVFAVVMSLLLVVAGLVSLSSLTVRYFPEFHQHKAVIDSSLPGASAQFMAGEVTDPILDAIGSVDGLEKISTESHNGASHISAEVKSSADYYAILNILRGKVARVLEQLPADMPHPPTVSDDSGANWNTIPTLSFGFHSETLSVEEVYDYLRLNVVPRLQSIDGVGAVPLFGFDGKVLWVFLDPGKMAYLNVSASDVYDALGNNNISISSGAITSQDKKYVLVSDTLLHTAADFAGIVIRSEHGQSITIGDVARVEWGESSLEHQPVLVNRREGIVMQVRPFSGANPVTVAHLVQKEMRNMSAHFPAALSMVTTYDQSHYLKKALGECRKAVFEAIGCVMLVMLVFLGSLRMAIIPVVTIPVCIVATFTVMAALGFSLNVVTLLAIVLAIGLVVDDAIVVVENACRHIDQGLSPREAALTGSRELVFAVVAMSLTLATVYLPVGFVHGFTAAILKEFAFTLAAAVLISGFVALTLTPMMCATVLQSRREASGIARRVTSVLDKLDQHYQRSLSVVLSHKTLVVSGMAVCFALGFIIYALMARELIPKEDIGYLETGIDPPPASSQAFINRNMIDLDHFLAEQPEIETVVSYYLDDPTNFITLQNWKQRDTSADELVKSLNAQVGAVVPAMNISFQLPDPVDYGIGPPGFKLKLMTVNRDPTASSLNVLSGKVVTALKDIEGLVNVSSSLTYNTPELEFTLNREVASRYGVALTDIRDSLQVMFGAGPRATQVRTPDGQSWNVRAQLDQAWLSDFSIMDSINVNSASGGVLPLSSLLTVRNKTALPAIETWQRQRSSTIRGDVVPGTSLAVLAQRVEDAVMPLLNNDQSMLFTGAIQQLSDSENSMRWLFLMAVVFIYLILAAQFESFIDPLVILLTVPLSIVGALFLLWLCGRSLNIYTNIGLLTLVGLVSKHGILIVSFANRLVAQGVQVNDAVIAAAGTRLRPILMTSLAMIFGALPLALATGPGSIGRSDIGLVLVGGMILGTLFSLLVVPVAYVIVSRYRALDVLSDFSENSSRNR